MGMKFTIAVPVGIERCNSKTKKKKRGKKERVFLVSH